MAVAVEFVRKTEGCIYVFCSSDIHPILRDVGLTASLSFTLASMVYNACSVRSRISTLHNLATEAFVDWDWLEDSGNVLLTPPGYWLHLHWLHLHHIKLGKGREILPPSSRSLYPVADLTLQNIVGISANNSCWNPGHCSDLVLCFAANRYCVWVDHHFGVKNQFPPDQFCQGSWRVFPCLLLDMEQGITGGV